MVIRGLAAVFLVGAALTSLWLLPVQEHLTAFLEWVQGLGNLGLVVLAAAYIPASLLFVPGLLLTLGGGFAFGLVRGTIAISLGSLAGASAAFLVGRFLARGFVETLVARSPTFRAIDQAVAEEGFKIVLLTRLSPLFPFNLLNYAFGLTQVRFRDYWLASWIGMLPGTVMYVYLGSAVKNLADLAAGRVEGGIGKILWFFAGLFATVAATVLITRVAKQALDKAIANPGELKAKPGPA
jgi:uncharacterized membrane protein YdjX (TVP38/TMEM64 family)